MADYTGTNFKQDVFAWSLDDFNIPYSSWTAGSTITVSAGVKPSVVDVDAVGKEPFLDSNPNNTFSVTGTVSNGSGTTTATFSDSSVSVPEYWEFNAVGIDGTVNQYWMAFATDGNGNEMLWTNYHLEAGSELSLTGLDISAGYKTPETDDFESIFDQVSQEATPEGIYGNASFFPRIDQVISPTSPKFREDITPGLAKVKVWSSDAFDIVTTNPDAPYGDPRGTFTKTADAVEGLFITSDGDDYISDGSAGYGNDVQNEFDQIGTLEFENNTQITDAYYQAENSYLLRDPNTGREFEVVRISFNGTDSTDYAWFSTAPIDDDVSYDIIDGDGSPGLWNGNAPEREMSFQYTELICYVQGSLIETAKGPVAVEKLRVGDLIKTKDNGMVPVRWVDFSTAPRDLLASDALRRPVRISAGALGNNLPEQDLYVSRQHRILIDSDLVEKAFGIREVFSKAKDFLDIVPGIELADVDEDVHYYHILLDAHQVIYANGIPSESFYPGETSMREFSPEMRRALFSAVPQAATLPQGGYPLARAHPKGTSIRACLHAHALQRAALVDPQPTHEVIRKRVSNMLAVPMGWVNAFVEKIMGGLRHPEKAD